MIFHKLCFKSSLLSFLKVSSQARPWPRLNPQSGSTFYFTFGPFNLPCVCARVRTGAQEILVSSQRCAQSPVSLGVIPAPPFTYEPPPPLLLLLSDKLLLTFFLIIIFHVVRISLLLHYLPWYPTGAIFLSAHIWLLVVLCYVLVYYVRLYCLLIRWYFPLPITFVEASLLCMLSPVFSRSSSSAGRWKPLTPHS